MTISRNYGPSVWGSTRNLAAPLRGVYACCWDFKLLLSKALVTCEWGGQGERECGRGGGRAGECAVMCLEDFIFSSSFFQICSMGLGFHLHASSSKPMPTLCPPALKFLPSIRAERVTFTPADAQKRSLRWVKCKALFYKHLSDSHTGHRREQRWGISTIWHQLWSSMTETVKYL